MLIVLLYVLTTVILLTLLFLNGKITWKTSLDKKQDQNESKFIHMVTSTTATPTAHEKMECFLFIAVMTTVDGKKRKVVRETWFQAVRSLQPIVQAKFFIGTQGLAEDQLTKLDAEELDHHDMIFLPDLVDQYFNLTRKTLASLIWIEENVNAEYVLKTEDDVYVVVKKILEELEARRSDVGLYWGRFLHKHPVRHQEEKFNQEQDWFLCTTFLPYAIGRGYVLSADVIQAFTRNVQMIQLYTYEDISLSVWVSSFKLERKHDRRFNVFEDPCKPSHLLYHCSHYSERTMQKFHHHVTDRGTLC